jgi:hypothetical protein
LDQLRSFPSKEGWNVGSEFEHYLDYLGSDAIILGCHPENGDIVSCILGAKYGKFGWIGLYICKKEFRGMGIGFQTWKKCFEMSQLKDCQFVGLDGVEAQRENYKKIGICTCALDYEST